MVATPPVAPWPTTTDMGDVAALLDQAAAVVREHAVRIAEDRDAAHKRGDKQWAWHLHHQWESAHRLADELAQLSPRAIEQTPALLHEAQQLATELVFRLGQLTAPRRVDASLSEHPATLRLMATKLVAYLRVSTDRQADEGLGLDVQEAAVRAWARQHRARIVHVCRDEGISGTADHIDRPGLAETLGHVQAGRAGGVVVYRLDRLARQLVLQEWIRTEIVRAGAELRSTSPTEDMHLVEDPTDPTGKLVRQILGAIAEYEREMIRLRMHAGKQRKAAAGGYVGGAPGYGYRARGHQLVPVDDELAVVRKMRRWRRESLSYWQIAARLNEQGVTTRRGGRWHPKTVRDVLARTERGKLTA